VAKFFGISPHEIDYEWTLPEFLDALEYVQYCDHLEQEALKKYDK
jgi:hypothetical protein